MHIRITPKRPPVDKGQWHMWFAWCPVRVGGYIVWLEYVQRKGHRGRFSDYWEWEYQPHDDVQISVQVFDEYAAEQRKQLEHHFRVWIIIVKHIKFLCCLYLNFSQQHIGAMQCNFDSDNSSLNEVAKSLMYSDLKIFCIIILITVIV